MVYRYDGRETSWVCIIIGLSRRHSGQSSDSLPYTYGGARHHVLAPQRFDSSSRSQNEVFDFSTKYQDVETGLLYYGFRYCAPSKAGRFFRGESPRRERVSHLPVSSVGDMKEGKPNDMA